MNKTQLEHLLLDPVESELEMEWAWETPFRFIYVYHKLWYAAKRLALLEDHKDLLTDTEYRLLALLLNCNRALVRGLAKVHTVEELVDTYGNIIEYQEQLAREYHELAGEVRG